MSIPKIIHYAWFGKGKMPELAEKCIESWKRHLPDYKLVEWNEENFDVNEFIYTKEAYENKKFAYVTDVVRLYALKNAGGIYMDTDVEVLKPLDRFLELKGFSGFESDTQIPTGIMAAEPHNQWISDQLAYYNMKSFFDLSGKIDYTTNVDIITQISKSQHGLIPNGKYQELKYGMVMFPKEYFCPKSVETGKLNITENTYTIHHFSGSWVSASSKRNKKILSVLREIFGDEKILSFYKKIKDK